MATNPNALLGGLLKRQEDISKYAVVSYHLGPNFDDNEFVLQIAYASDKGFYALITSREGRCGPWRYSVMGRESGGTGRFVLGEHSRTWLDVQEELRLARQGTNKMGEIGNDEDFLDLLEDAVDRFYGRPAKVRVKISPWTARFPERVYGRVLQF